MQMAHHPWVFGPLLIALMASVIAVYMRAVRLWDPKSVPAQRPAPVEPPSPARHPDAVRQPDPVQQPDPVRQPDAETQPARTQPEPA
jgi:hypothetical protein